MILFMGIVSNHIQKDIVQFSHMNTTQANVYQFLSLRHTDHRDIVIMLLCCYSISVICCATELDHTIRL